VKFLIAFELPLELAMTWSSLSDSAFLGDRVHALVAAICVHPG
jgi:hypothetical protein